jgi:hypothetical protein
MTTQQVQRRTEREYYENLRRMISQIPDPQARATMTAQLEAALGGPPAEEMSLGRPQGGAPRGKPMMGPPIDEPIVGPPTVGSTFEAKRGNETYSVTITNIIRGPDGSIRGAEVTHDTAGGQRTPAFVKADALREYGFDLSEGAEPTPGPWYNRAGGALRNLLPGGDEGPFPGPARGDQGPTSPPQAGQSAAVPITEPRPAPIPPGSPPRPAGFRPEVERGTGNVSMVNQDPGAIGALPGYGEAPDIPDLGETGETNLWEQQGLTDILRGLVLGGNVTPGFQGLEEARLGRHLIPFLVQQGMAGEETNSPSAFRQYLSSIGGASPQLGSALEQIGGFLGQSFSADSLQEGAQLGLRGLLESGIAGAVGSELFSPALAIVGQGMGRRFGIDMGPYVQQALENQMARDPTQYVNAEQLIQGLKEQGILGWLNKRF